MLSDNFAVRLRGGVQVEDLVVGDGAVAERGTTVQVGYTGFLNRGDAFQRGEVATFRVGQRRVIAGLEYGVEGMRVGGMRRVHVPPHLGYAEDGVPGIIPANAKLLFEVELLRVIPADES